MPMQAAVVPTSSSSSSASKAAVSAASSMERTSQWVSSQDVPADLIVRVAGAAFRLHKAVMVPKCGHIRKVVASTARSTSAVVELELSGFPGGAEAFEKAARYCYGANFEISARNAAPLLCAAEFLGMDSGGGGLAGRVEEFLAKVGLRTLPGAVAVLRSCEGETLNSVPAADDLARRAADAVALRICNEALFATRSPTDWWAAELAVLSPASFNKVVAALRSRRAGPEILSAAAIGYVELRLAEPVAEEDHRALLDSVVAVLPPCADAPLPPVFLCRLLRAALTIDAEESTTRRDLELRLASVLDQATPADLLSFALEDDNDSTQPPRAAHLDTLRRVITAFISLTSAGSPDDDRSNSNRRRSSLSSSPPAPSTAAKMQKVAKTIDEVAAEIATEETLPISKFVSIAGAIPRESRSGGAAHDCVYRAVDVYLKAHPGLDEIEREKVCSVMDPLKLSPAARLHASQNKRLPLQAVLSALYYDQLKLRSGQHYAGDEDDRSEAGSARMQAKADAALARENEALRSELARMRAHMSSSSSSSSGSGGGQRSKGSGSRTPVTGKLKVGFFGSVSRTLSRLNPFRAGGGGWAKDTSSIAGAAIVKPKRRRFSIG